MNDREKTAKEGTSQSVSPADGAAGASPPPSKPSSPAPEPGGEGKRKKRGSPKPGEPSEKCGECGKVVGLYADGRCKPHNEADGKKCVGSRRLPASRRKSPSSSKGTRGTTKKADDYKSHGEEHAAVEKGAQLVQSLTISEGDVEIEIPIPGSTRDFWEMVNGVMVHAMPGVWKDLDAPLPKLPGAKKASRGTQLDLLVLAYDKMLHKWMPWLLQFGPEVVFGLANLAIVTPRAHACIEAYLDSRKKRLRKDKSDGGNDPEGEADVPDRSGESV